MHTQPPRRLRNTEEIPRVPPPQHHPALLAASPAHTRRAARRPRVAPAAAHHLASWFAYRASPPLRVAHVPATAPFNPTRCTRTRTHAPTHARTHTHTHTHTDLGGHRGLPAAHGAVGPATGEGEGGGGEDCLTLCRWLPCRVLTRLVRPVP